MYFRLRGMDQGGNSNPFQADTTCPFPTPPLYATLYHADYIKHGVAPGPPPVCSDFTAFGDPYHMNAEIVPSLQSVNIRQLYVSKLDFKNEMKKLNRSVVAAFCDLIDILVRCPASQDRVEKLNDIHDIFVNMHHIVNEYRPVQARDTLLLMQQKQVTDLEACLQALKQFRVQASTSAENDLKTAQSEMNLLPIPQFNEALEGEEEILYSEKEVIEKEKKDGRGWLARRRGADEAVLASLLS